MKLNLISKYPGDITASLPEKPVPEYTPTTTTAMNVNVNGPAQSESAKRDSTIGTQLVAEIFDQARSAIDEVAPAIQSQVADAGHMLIECLDRNGTIFACGNGGSAADAIHFTGELIGRFVDDRRPLSALALTTDTAVISAVSNDYGFDHIFSRQLRGLARAGDVLVAISTSGNSANVVEAVKMAQSLGVTSILLSGRDGGKLASMLDAQDLEIRVALKSTARIQELHGIIIHCLCDLIDRRYQGEI